VSESSLNADRPAAEDLLERGPLVRQLAGWVLDAPATDGFVVGVTGPWGSGKTTVLGLLEKHLGDEATVIWFDPWLFSKADDLISRFFDEIASTLAAKGKNLKKVAKGMANFGAALSPAAGVVLGPAGQLIAAPKRLAELKQSSAASQRDELRDALLRTGRRIVVLIDDIDRLDAREIREIMRLVKLVADLPGVVHVLAYERTRVEHAVTEPGLKDGRAYIEKIVQAHLTVPPVSRERLRSMSMEWLEEAIGRRAVDGWDPTAWSELLIDGIDGYLHTMRDGRRLANMAPAAISLCAGEVAAMDVIALETMRIFDPTVHDALPELVNALLGSDNILEAALKDDKLDAKYRAQLTGALEHSSQPDAARHLLSVLFPSASHLLGHERRAVRSRARLEKRVAARPVFMRYLHLVLAPEEVPSSLVDDAVAALASAQRLQSLLDDVDDDRLADLLGRTIARIDEQPHPDVLGCSIVLMELIPRLRRETGFLGVAPADRIRWLVGDLVESGVSDEKRTDVACKLVREATTLSLRLDMLHEFSKDPAREPRLDLFDAPTYSRLARELAEDVQASDADVLTAETGVFRLLSLMHEALGPAAVLKKCTEPPVLRAVLQTKGTEVRGRARLGVALHLEPLIAIAGPDVVDVLTDLAEQDTELPADLRAALDNELVKHQQHEPPEGSPLAD
jgi:hypothetical protein